MKKNLVLLGLIALVILFCFPSQVLAGGDTGTYRILDYRVSLTPQSDGSIEMRYEQRWLVTGGHIPWVTVGLANSKFTIKSFGGAAKSVKPEIYSGWTGVRVDLDKDYKQNETFQFYFVISQQNLLERLTKEQKWRISFTPGWYDRCFTDLLQIKLISPVKTESLSLAPQPTLIQGQEVIWEKKNLGKGERFSIKVESTDSSFLQQAQQPGKESKPEKESKKGFPGWAIALMIIGGIFFFFIIIMIFSSSGGDNGSAGGRGGRGGSGTRRKDDDYVPPVIIAPRSRGSSSGSSSGGRSTGGGGGFGGRSSSCACVSCACACACACAGGGAAGCAKKREHFCKICWKKELKNEEK